MLKIKKVNKDAIIPDYAFPNDSGMDLYSCENITIFSGKSKLIDTGIQIALPEGTEAQIRPKSGIALKSTVTVLNAPGSIDRGFSGNIQVLLINHGKQKFVVEIGQKIAQMVISPVLHPAVLVVDSLDETDRSTGGFGSTGLFKKE